MDSVFFTHTFQIEVNPPEPTESEETRETGNSLYKSGQLFAALAQYNKALVLAAGDQEQASLCYGNRSAVYLKLQYFAHCLHNIDLAEPHFPREKIQKLHDRREECQKMMKKCEDKAMEPFEYASKLSYEPNPKIPFFIHALEIKDDLMNGKHVITTQDLKAGDVIGIVNPWQVPIDYPSSDYKLACYNCFDMNNGDLIPGNCAEECPPLFCSEKCRDEHSNQHENHAGIHDLEYLHETQLDTPPASRHAISLMFAHNIFLKLHDSFGSVEQMRKFVENHKKNNHQSKYSFFDFDWSMGEDDPQYYENMLLLIMSPYPESLGAPSLLRKMSPETSNSRMVKIYHDQWPLNRIFMDLLFIEIIATCGLKMQFHPIHNTNCVFAVFCHQVLRDFNSSCDPNAMCHHENHNGSRKFVLTVVQPIAAGKKVTIPWQLYFRKQRCNETSHCTPCRENWADQIDETKLQEDIQKHIKEFFKKGNDPKKVSAIIKHRARLCNFINKNFTGYHKDPKVRQTIATKIEELRMNLNFMGNPMPAAGRFHGLEYLENQEIYNIPEIVYE